MERFTKKKDYLLVAGIILLALIGYQLAFKKTLEAWQTGKLLKSQLPLSADLSYQPGYLRRKNANLDSIIRKFKADTLNFRDHSIGVVTTIAENQNVKIREVPVQDASFNSDKRLIQRLTFEGDFFSLTSTLNKLEAEKGIGFVRSVSYRLSKSPDSILFSDVYLLIAK